MRKVQTGLVALLLAGTASAALADTVKLGLQPWLGYGPLWIAEEKGFFADHGVDVALSNFNWDADMTAALAAGNLDVIAAGTNAMIAAQNAGVDQTAFLVMDLSFEADAIIAPDSMSSIKDLAGHKVAFETGATSDLLMNYALKVNGMRLADIEHVPMGASEAGLALLSGNVEAAVTYEPYISAALNKSEGFKVLYTAAEKPGLISDVLTARGDWLAAHPAEAAGIVAAWDDAVKFIRDNPEEGGALIARAVGSPMEEFAPAFAGVRLYDAAENMAFLSGDFQETLTEIGAIMMETNPDEITRMPTEDELLDLGALKAVTGQ